MKNLSSQSAPLWTELAHILEIEWRGNSIDRRRARELAGNLLPAHPELKNTLTHIQARLSEPAAH